MAIKSNRGMYDKLLNSFNLNLNELFTHFRNNSNLGGASSLIDFITKTENYRNIDFIPSNSIRLLRTLKGIVNKDYAILPANNKIYILYNPTGDSITTTTLIEYDPVTNVDTRRTMGVGMLDGFAFVYKNKVYYKNESSTTSTLYISELDTELGLSSLFATLNISVGTSRFLVDGDDVYFIVFGSPIKVYKLNMITKAVTTVRDITVTGVNNNVLAKNGDVLYLFGTSSDNKSLQVYAYNLVTKTQQNTTITRTYATAEMNGVQLGNNVYLQSGIPGACEVYNLQTKTLTPISGYDMQDVSGTLFPVCCTVNNRVYMYDNPVLSVLYT